MIKSIELVNWKTHGHTTIDFQRGVNVLIGVMGAGKSSVMDGISFGLFGTFPALTHKRTNTENLISNRPTIKDSAEVRLKFTVGEDEYVVSRKINRGESTTARLEKNGNYLQAQPVRVNEEIESLIKLDYDTFSRAVYAEQNKIDYFLELTKSERKKQIDQMLGLDNFARAEENATSLINSIKSMIADEEQMLEQSDIQGMKKQLDALLSEKKALDSDQATLQALAKEKVKQLKELSDRLLDMKLASERSRKLQKEITELASKVQIITVEFKKIEQLGISKSSIESEFEARNATAKRLDEEMGASRKSESELLAKIAELQGTIKLNQKKLLEKAKLLEQIKGRDPESMEKRLHERESHMQESLKVLLAAKGNRQELAKWAKELGEHISKCPVCERELSEQMRSSLLSQKSGAIKEADALIQKQEEGVKTLEEELASHKKELDSVKIATSKMSEYEGIDALIINAEASEKDIKGKHLEVREGIERINSSREELSKDLAQITIKRDAIARKEKYEIDIRESSAQLAKKQDEMAKLGFEEKQLYALQELITKQSSEQADTASKITSNERYLKSMSTQIEERAKAVENLDAMSGKIEKKRSQLSNMNKFRSALIETEAHLRNSLVSSINSLMADIWSNLYPYGDYTSIRLSAKKDDYLLEASTGVDEEGKSTWIEIDGIASGGERSVACLTMRIALSMVIVPNLKWLILDEPTHNIDENGINRFIDVLGSSLPKFVEQVFIITHDGSLKNISSARVYQFDRDKGKSEHTVVSEL